MTQQIKALKKKVKATKSLLIATEAKVYSLKGQVKQLYKNIRAAEARLVQKGLKIAESVPDQAGNNLGDSSWNKVHLAFSGTTTHFLCGTEVQDERYVSWFTYANEETWIKLKENLLDDEVRALLCTRCTKSYNKWQKKGGLTTKLSLRLLSGVDSGK